ncbi:MAG: phosphodiester glycosidase family protein [Polyangiaceae bacterium]|nr:phosphodiester glycosidase family protein [Polyangiaceae bacterium]
MKTWVSIAFAALIGAGCGPGGSALSQERSPRPARAPSASSGTASTPTIPPTVKPPEAQAQAAPGPTAAPGESSNASPPPVVSALPPPKFNALHARTAKPGDGEWTPMPHGAAAGEPPVLYQTVAHPHPIKKYVYVTIVAIDRSRVDLHLVAGTLEPESKTVPAERRPGLIPQAHQDDLIAVFNGGFMAKHGRYGMMIDGDIFLPPRDELCSVALLRDRSVRIQTWKDLRASERDIVAFRQTPPCILVGGVPHPELETDRRPRPWGGAENGDVEVRRSALGLDATGNVLFYGLGEWVTVKALADSMRAAGAVNAAQLDINWSYTRFLFFGRPAPGDPLQVTETLIPKIKHSKQGYVTNPSERDFFYLRRIRPISPARNP